MRHVVHDCDGLCGCHIRAVPFSNEPNKVNYYDWFYKDLLCLFESEWKQWFNACELELDMLKLEITGHSTGWKIIKNWWVFDQKFDVHKCVQLVMCKRSWFQSNLQPSSAFWNSAMHPCPCCLGELAYIQSWCVHLYICMANWIRESIWNFQNASHLLT